MLLLEESPLFESSKFDTSLQRMCLFVTIIICFTWRCFSNDGMGILFELGQGFTMKRYWPCNTLRYSDTYLIVLEHIFISTCDHPSLISGNQFGHEHPVSTLKFWSLIVIVFKLSHICVQGLTLIWESSWKDNLLMIFFVKFCSYGLRSKWWI